MRFSLALPLVASLILVKTALGQPDELWSRIYSGGNGGSCNSIIQTADRRFTMAGWTTSVGAGQTDLWLVRTDANGDSLWSRKFGGEGYDDCRSLIQTADGGFALAGYKPSFGGVSSLLVRTDNNGDSLWSQTYGEENNANSALIQTADGGFALAGYKERYQRGPYDFWLVRTDENGNSLWSRSFGGAGDNVCWSAIQTADGGFALAGSTTFGAGNYDFWLVRTNADGDSLWSRTFGGENPDICYSLIQTLDGGFALAGSTRSFPVSSDQFWLMRTDANGDSLWSHTYGGNRDDICYSVIQKADGGFVLGGNTNSFGAGNADMWLVRTNENGDSLWSRTFDGEGDDCCNSLIQTADCGYALAGYSQSFGAGLPDFWLVKTGLDPVIAHPIPLRQGWNILSSVCQPANSAVRTVFSEVVSRNNLVLAKDQSGRFYNPAIGENGFSNMAPFDVRQGYMAKLADEDTLVIVNIPVTGETPIPLHQGWNIAAYFPEADLTAPDAFAGLGDNLEMVKDESGRFYRRLNGFSNMGRLTRGKGYQLKVAQDGELVYPAGQRVQAEVKVEVEREPEHFKAVTMTGANMSVLLNVERITENGKQVEIGAFTKTGLCVGSALFDIRYPLSVGMAVWGDDPTTPEVDGAREGEALDFRLWALGEEQEVRVVWEKGEAVYQTDGFVMGNLTTKNTKDTKRPNQFALNGAFPNPFNGAATIRFSLPEESNARLSLVDLSGREVMTVLKGRLKAGENVAALTSDGLPSGVYYIKLSSDAGTLLTKAVILR